jgi:hypothetical protein
MKAAAGAAVGENPPKAKNFKKARLKSPVTLLIIHRGRASQAFRNANA